MPQVLRRALDALLPGVQLRIDGGGALFRARHTAEDAQITALGKAGFDARQEGAFLHITPHAEWMAPWTCAVLEEGPPAGLPIEIEALIRDGKKFLEWEIAPADYGLWLSGLKLGGLGPARGASKAYEKQLRMAMAGARRRGEGGGGLYACALCLGRLHRP